ncbi:hypothetical protein [Microbacterium sp. SORGH_AS_0454]|uniref:hypothetical protein n=1 Tax=Microbacterium sp. SORGH_AS_0454 TaxID=3041758 RepID=UPI0028576599|nr:hypothetical protein [Microbacterium sp. SORGH_AS_0454]MDR6098909.1 hypothetical protein [Microbacterium sp. SORGH_AS_0454]
MPFISVDVMGSATDLTFRTPDGGAVIIHAADLITVSEERDEVISFGGFTFRDANKITATLRLHPRPNGQVLELLEPARPEPTPIYDRLAGGPHHHGANA